MTPELPDFAVLRSRYDKLSLGARAELRRVNDPDELNMTTALYRLFPGERPDDHYLRLAYLLPWCRHLSGARSFGAQLADAKVSEARVLLTARAQYPLDIVQLRRLVMHTEPAVDWTAFGCMLWHWNEYSKRKLVEDFYFTRFNPAKGGEK